MRVLFVSAEVSPFAKTGGLADVALALPRALAQKGVDVRVVMPKFRGVQEKVAQVESAGMSEAARFRVPVAGEDKACIAFESTLPGCEVPIYFLGHDPYYDRAAIYGEGTEYEDALERFTFFSRAALALCGALDWAPDLVHANDWHAALIPGLIRDGQGGVCSGAKTMLTIHNLGYQGSFPVEQSPIVGFSEAVLAPYVQGGKINLLKGGILSVDLINTVSPTYAKEILIDGAGLESDLKARQDVLYGVVNGVDLDVWNPKTDPHLWANFDVDDLTGKALNKSSMQKELGLGDEPETPVLGVISRLAEQKGFDLIMDAFDSMMGLGVQFVLLGTGAQEYEAFFAEAQTRYPGRVASMITFSEAWAHRIEASADMFLMPSHYEPCGLNQQYSLRYGTVPVVRATGGLVDTVQEFDAAADSGTGFLFSDCTADAFLGAVRRAVEAYRNDREAWRELVLRGMRQDLSWDASADAYKELYAKLTTR